MLNTKTSSEASLTFQLPSGEGLEIRLVLPFQEPQRREVVSLLEALDAAGQAWQQAHAKQAKGKVVGKTIYTTASRVAFAVIDPNGGFGQLVVDIAPGETKTVEVNGRSVTIHRPLIR